MAEVEHFPPERLAELPADHDLYLCVDDGLDYAFSQRLHPSAFWAIDTHLDFARALRRAKEFDFVFAAQKEGAERLQREGIAHCEWLPLACDPEIHRSLDFARDKLLEGEKRWDVAFVGHVFGEARRQLLEQVQRRFPNSFVGQVPHTEMAEVYSRARIVINASLANDLNMRVFEALSCGALLITNHLEDNGQEELFQDRVHLVEYRTPEEALELIAYYLAHEEERERIAAAGHAEVIAKHTYRHRMERLLARREEFVVSEARAAGRPGSRQPPRLAEVEKAMVARRSALEQSSDDTDWVNQRLRELRREQEALRVAQRGGHTGDAPAVDRETVRRYVAGLPGLLRDATDEEKRELARTFVTGIGLDPETREIEIGLRAPLLSPTCGGGGPHRSDWHNTGGTGAGAAAMHRREGAKGGGRRRGRAVKEYHEGSGPSIG